jgi:hypothetical protein
LSADALRRVAKLASGAAHLTVAYNSGRNRRPVRSTAFLRDSYAGMWKRLSVALA